jgi:hypothetical protein
MSDDTHESPALYVREGSTYRAATADELMQAAQRAISYRFRRGMLVQHT